MFCCVENDTVPTAPVDETPVTSTGIGSPHAPLDQVSRPHPVRVAIAAPC